MSAIIEFNRIVEEHAMSAKYCDVCHELLIDSYGAHPMKPTEEQYERAIQIAAERGAEDGRNAAAWWEQDAIGGRVTGPRDALARNTAENTLRGIEDGDPEILDALPSADLSGQWAGLLTGPRLVLECWEEVGVSDYLKLMCADEDAFNEICDAYEEAFNQAAQDAAERACRDLLED